MFKSGVGLWDCMKSEIIFLGTGGARKVTASQERATGGIVLKIGETQLWIDPGPGALVRARQFNVDPAKTDIVLVSHEHIDHVNDMNAVLDAMCNGGFRTKGHVVSVKRVIETFLADYLKKNVESMHILKAGDSVSFGDIKIIATGTKHDIEGIGFKVITSGFNLGYTADTYYFPDLANEFKNVDILIINNLKPFGQKLEKHMDSGLTVKLLEKVRPRLAIITGFGRSMIKADPLQEARKIEKLSKVQVVAAEDGLRINPDDYSAKTGQKTLVNF